MEPAYTRPFSASVLLCIPPKAEPVPRACIRAVCLGMWSPAAGLWDREHEKERRKIQCKDALSRQPASPKEDTYFTPPGSSKAPSARYLRGTHPGAKGGSMYPFRQQWLWVGTPAPVSQLCIPVSGRTSLIYICGGTAVTVLIKSLLALLFGSCGCDGCIGDNIYISFLRLRHFVQRHQLRIQDLWGQGESGVQDTRGIQ